MKMQSLKVERKKNIAENYTPPKPEPIKRRFWNRDKPQWKHNCKHCYYLTSDERFDYYVHVSELGAEPTFLVRDGNEPEEYSSFSMSNIISMILDGYIDDPLVYCMKYALRSDRVRVAYKTTHVFENLSWEG